MATRSTSHQERTDTSNDASLQVPTALCASSKDWDRYVASRYRRGWEWLALSMGVRPRPRDVQALEGAVRERYRDLKALVRNAASPLLAPQAPRDHGRVYYDTQIKLPASARKLGEKAINWPYDVVEIVRFLRGQKVEIHPRLAAAASTWTSADIDVSKLTQPSRSSTTLAAPEPDRLKVKAEKSAQSRVEKDTQALLLAMAVSVYGYRPVGMAGGPRRDADLSDVYEEMAKDVARLGLRRVSANQIATRLKEAVAGLDEDHRTALSEALNEAGSRTGSARR